MLIVEEIRNLRSSALRVSRSRMCHLRNGTRTFGFFGTFWRAEHFFLKMLHEDVCNYRRNGRSHSYPRSLFIELVVVREVIVRQCSIKGIRLEGTCDILNMLSVFDWDLCEEGFYIEAH